MDGGAWLPLRTRYLPRWHHTGSYQLYPGEPEGDLGPEVRPEAPRGSINIHHGSCLRQHGFSWGFCGFFEVLGSRGGELQRAGAEKPNAYVLRYLFRDLTSLAEL